MRDNQETNAASMSAMAGAELAGRPQPSSSLAPRLIKSMQADYHAASFDPEVGNISGLVPYGPNVLVRMDECSEVSQGGVLLPGDMVERMTESSVTGCIYAIGPDAFAGLQHRPQVGQRIYIEKYAGIKTRGRDGAMYRVLDERNVACGIADDLVVAEV